MVMWIVCRAIRGRETVTRRLTTKGGILVGMLMSVPFWLVVAYIVMH